MQFKGVPLRINKLGREIGPDYKGTIPYRISKLMRRRPNNFNLFGPR